MKILFAAATLIAMSAAPPETLPVPQESQENRVQIKGQVSRDGRPLSGQYTIKLALYDRPVGGQPVMEQRYAGVFLGAGRFSLTLGQFPDHRQPLFVELALRPHRRRYAEFEIVQPRQQLIPGRTSRASVLQAQINNPTEGLEIQVNAQWQGVSS